MEKGIIKQLDELTASQIAAGEVVERPASVVKELVENALDAGARHIEVRLGADEELAVISQIEVVDDGCGILRADLAAAFGRHATSKLSGAADLDCISTLGFRGEALPSIAAVSRVEIASCAEGEQEACGWQVQAEGGRISEPEEVAIVQGTRVRVRDLFYNTPARRKFLKSYSLECGQVSRLLGDFVLARPEVAFSLQIDRRQVLRSPGSGGGRGGDLAKGVLAVYGAEVLEALRPVSFDSGQVKVSGFVSAPPFARSSRRYFHFFVNGRLIKSQELGGIVDLAYQSLLPEKRHPLVILGLELPYDSVDINVHPAKTEIKFKQLGLVREAVLQAVREALAPRIRQAASWADNNADKIENNMMDKINNNMANNNEENNIEDNALPVEADGMALLQAFLNESGGQSRPARAAEPGLDISGGEVVSARGAEQAKASEVPDLKNLSGAEAASLLAEQKDEPGFAAKLFANLMASAPGRQVEYSRDDGDWLAENFGITYLEQYDSKTSESQQLFGQNDNLFYALRPLGQLNNSYIIAVYGEDLYIIDQHAAHERILYEEFALAFALDAQASSMLAVPVRIDAGALNCELLLNSIDRLADFGFVLEHFGGSSFVIRGVPLWYVRGMESDHRRKSEVYDNDIGGFFLAVLDMLLDGGETPDIGRLNKLELFTKACKSAIKANEHLNNQEISWLLHNLAECEKPQTCPHGRPTYIKLEDSEIRRRFMRS